MANCAYPCVEIDTWATFLVAVASSSQPRRRAADRPRIVRGEGRQGFLRL